jgi:hypothetical protein
MVILPKLEGRKGGGLGGRVRYHSLKGANGLKCIFSEAHQKFGNL